MQTIVVRAPTILCEGLNSFLIMNNNLVKVIFSLSICEWSKYHSNVKEG